MDEVGAAVGAGFFHIARSLQRIVSFCKGDRHRWRDIIGVDRGKEATERQFHVHNVTRLTCVERASGVGEIAQCPKWKLQVRHAQRLGVIVGIGWMCWCFDLAKNRQHGLGDTRDMAHPACLLSRRLVHDQVLAHQHLA